MRYNPAIHHRRSIRLSGYDYSQAGAYFVTLCTHGYQYLFGDIVEEEMQLSAVGRQVAACWEEIPVHFPNVELDAFVIMPNHVHGIIVITESTTVEADNYTHVGANNDSPRQPDRGATPPETIRGNNHARVGANNDSPRQPDIADSPKQHQNRPTGTSKTIGSIVRGFKIGVTKWVRAQNPYGQNIFRPDTRCPDDDVYGRKIFRPDTPISLWQRNYYEHIIRNESELFRIRKYIHENPAKWYWDRLNQQSGDPSHTARESGAPYNYEEWMI